MPSNFVATVAFYVLLFIATLITILNTTYNYPLFPIQSGSLEWNRTWLITTVIDYYGACLCFCGVVLSTEISWARGLAWVTGFCLLGSPVCCFWVLLWLFRGGGSLKLERQRDGYESPRELWWIFRYFESHAGPVSLIRKILSKWSFSEICFRSNDHW